MSLLSISLFIQSFISVWTHIYFIILWMVSITMLFVLLLKLFQLWPLEAPSGWLLCPFDMYPSFCVFEDILAFWHYKVHQGLLCYYIFCPSPRTRHIPKGLSVGYACCYWGGFVFNEEMLSSLVIFGVQTLLDLGNISFWYLTFTGTPTTVCISFIHLTFIEYLRVKLNRKVQRLQSVQNVYQKGEILGN